MNRLEQAIPAGIIMLVGLWVAFTSYTQTPAQAFVFPRLVSAMFAVLSVWVFVQALMKDGETGATIPKEMWLKILPGLAVSGIYVFWAAKAFGFYTATTVAVFILISMYDPAPHSSPKSWMKRVAITAGFMIVMYLLFKMLLGVFTPREILFR